MSGRGQRLTSLHSPSRCYVSQYSQLQSNQECYRHYNDNHIKILKLLRADLIQPDQMVLIYTKINKKWFDKVVSLR